MRIVAADQSALRLGLTRGLSLADARARIPDIVVADADFHADARFIESLTEACDRFTPSVALDGPDGLILDIAGCAHLFGGESHLRKKVLSRMERIGVSARATIAGSPDAARALVRFGRVDVASEGQDAALVERLPAAAIPGLDRETVLALSRAGLKTVGDLAARPPQALAARFGQELVTRLARTLGLEDQRITPLRPAPRIVIARQFAEPFTEAAALEDVLSGLIIEAVLAMQARDEGGRAFEASFFRSDGAVRRLAVQTGKPSRDAPAILKLFRERMDSIADPIDPGFGFDCVRLAALVTEPLAPLQPKLDRSADDSDAVGDLVDRLVARFGRERVLRFEARDTHDPDRESKSAPAADVAKSAWNPPEPGEPPLRPLHLFDPPQPIDALAEVPDGPPLRFRWRRVLHEVARAEGPERIAPEWSRFGANEPERDYYRVEDSAGRRYWIFRRGLYGAGDSPPRWFLHGAFA